MKNSIYIITFLVLIVALNLRAQNPPIIVPSFVKMDSNRLHFSADTGAFRNLFRKMDALQQESITRLNIVHIGGSHIQAGIWSNAFSSGLQAYFHTLGGGYFGFPYKYAKTNGQYYLSTFSTAHWKKCRAVNVDFCLPLGMAGLSVASNDSAGNFGAALNAKSACRFVNNIRVYHNFNPSFQFQFNTPAAGKIERLDNREGGYSLFSFENPIDSLVFDFTRVDTNQRDFILYGFSLENDLSSGVFLAALGVNGASTNSFLRCSEFTRQLPSLKGDLFILSMGVNDTQSADFTAEKFYTNYDSLITLIRSVNPDAAIILTTTTDNYIRRKSLNKKTIPARDVMYDLMEARHVAVWDMFEIMGGPKSILKWSQAGLASKDRVHFTAKGYNLLGRLMMDALLQSYLHSKTQIKQ